MSKKFFTAEFLKKFMYLSDEKAASFINNLMRVRTLCCDKQLDVEVLENFLEGFMLGGRIYESVISAHVNNNDFDKKKHTDNSTYNLLELIAPLLEQLNEIFCFKNTNFEFMGCNNSFVDFGKFKSNKNILGHTDYEMPWVEGTHFYRTLDEATLNGKCHKTLMPLRVTTGDKSVVLQEKYPLRDSFSDIRGIAIRMRMISNPIVFRPFISLYEEDLITPELAGYVSDKYLIRETYDENISNEESKCLFYVMRGKTAKEISKILGKAPKTIESHIERARLKLSCQNKAELISKSVQLGLMNIIPEEILNAYLHKTN